MSTSPAEPSPGDTLDVQEKTRLPGQVLQRVGIFNLLLSLYLVGSTVQSWRMTFEEREAQLERLHLPGFLKGGQAEIIKLVPVVSALWSALSFGAALLVIVAGSRLKALRSYGLVMTGAVVACIPCISCAGCVGLGQLAGLWALMLLLKPEVRLAFR